MDYAKLILDRLAETVRTVRPVERHEHLVLLPDWQLKICVTECQVQETPGRCIVQTSLVAYHSYLPNGFVRELFVGVGKDLTDAINHGLIGWWLLLLPTLKFIFDEQPHDCTVNVVDIEAPNGPGRVIEGPVQMVGFGDTSSTDMSQSRLWDTFANRLLPKLSPGVHHLRCYTCKTRQGISADVFLDGAEWPEGSEALKRLAVPFPEPDEANPIYSLKQHLLVRPLDLHAGVQEQRQQQVAQWQQAIAAPADSAVRSLVPQVLQATYLITRHRGLAEAEYEELLMAEEVPAAVAAQLVTFLPSAATWVLMKGKVQLSDEYLWTNHQTRQAARRRYHQTPVFMAALHSFEELARQGMAAEEMWAIASGSAEMKCISQAMVEGGTLDGARITCMIVHTDEPVNGEDVDVLAKRLNVYSRAPRRMDKPWWKFW